MKTSSALKTNIYLHLNRLTTLNLEKQFIVPSGLLCWIVFNPFATTPRADQYTKVVVVRKLVPTVFIPQIHSMIQMISGNASLSLYLSYLSQTSDKERVDQHSSSNNKNVNWGHCKNVSQYIRCICVELLKILLKALWCWDVKRYANTSQKIHQSNCSIDSWFSLFFRTAA